MPILIGRYIYINAVPISKCFIAALSVRTNIKHLAIMMRNIIYCKIQVLMPMLN
jgi:hypothetical protein